MKRFIKIAMSICIFMYAFVTVVFAQEDEWRFPVVYVDTPDNNSNLSKELVAQFASSTKGGISASKRITMIDETTEKALQLELGRRDKGTAIDVNTLFNKLTTAGADYIVKAQLNGSSCERIVPEKSSGGVGKFLDAITGTDPYYKAKITWNIIVVSVKGGKVIVNRTFETEGRTSKDEKEIVAYTNAISKMAVTARNVINSVVPLNGSILKIESVNKKKDKAETVILDLGTRKGLAAGDYAKVCIEADIAGEKTYREIGNLRIEEVLSPNRSLGNVKDGKKEILGAFNKGQTLVVTVY